MVMSCGSSLKSLSSSSSVAWSLGITLRSGQRAWLYWAEPIHHTGQHNYIQRTAPHCATLHHTAPHYSTTRFNTTQHIASQTHPCKDV